MYFHIYSENYPRYISCNSLEVKLKYTIRNSEIFGLDMNMTFIYLKFKCFKSVKFALQCYLNPNVFPKKHVYRLVLMEYQEELSNTR
jgi:hypothetical protein